MKKLLYIFLFLSLPSLLLAQDSTASKSAFKPQKGDVGTTLNLTGLIDNIQLQTTNSELGQNLLFLRYYLEDDLVLRLGLGVDFNSYKRSVADSVINTLVEEDSLFNRFVFNISGGIEKHFSSSKRLDPYVFGQMNITFVGKENTEVDTRITAPNGVGTVERIIKKDGGIGFGLLFGGGFNYFIAKNFSVGTEVGLLINYSSIGGTISDNTISNPINGSSSSNFITSEDRINQAEIGVQANALLNFSYFF
jgi:hypothetical protein